jgi:hypothetical protein
MTDTKTECAAAEALAKAQAVLADLTREKVAAVARQAELARVRPRLALAGLADGGAASDKRALDDATTESARNGLKIENLSYAIAEATERVASARSAVERAAFRAKVSTAQEEQADLRKAAADTVSGLDAFLAGFDRIVSAANAIRRSGVGRFPSDEIFQGACRRSLQAALMSGGRHLNSEPVIVAVAQRRPLGEVIERFLDELKFSIDRQWSELAEPEAEAAE